MSVEASLLFRAGNVQGIQRTNAGLNKILAQFCPLQYLADSWQIVFSEDRETHETPSAVTG